MSLKNPTKRKKSLALPKKGKSLRLTPTGPDQAGLSTCGIGKNVPTLNTTEEYYLCLSRNSAEEDVIESRTNTTKALPISLSQKEATLSIKTFVCPICSIDLTTKTRLQRLAHGNTCLDDKGNRYNSTSATAAETTHIPSFKAEADDDFNLCVLCGKDIRKYNHQAREQHTNRCLDEVVLEQQVIQASKKTAEKYRIDNTYGNKPIPDSYAVTSCPCCHEDWTEKPLSLRRKMLHMKSCSRSNNISIQELGRRLQWSNWGLRTRPAPSDSKTIPQNSEEEVKSTDLTVPEASEPLGYFLYDESFVLCTSDDEHFETAAPKPRMTSSIYRKKSKSKGKNDEDLQLAIALSRSMEKESKKVKGRNSGKATAASKNESCVLSLEESKLVVLRNLENLLCAPKITSNDVISSCPALPPSKLAKSFEKSASQRGNKTPPLLWTIASSDSTKSDCFTTDFLDQFLAKKANSFG